MTPRDKAVAAVVEAARGLCLANTARQSTARTMALMDALRALDALPPEPEAAGDVVEVAVWEITSDGDIQITRVGSDLDRMRGDWSHWTRLGTTRMHVKKEAKP